LGATARDRAWSAVQAAADGIIITNLAGRVQHMNPEAERLTGCPCESAAGRPLAEILRLEEKHGRIVRSDLVRLAILQGQRIGLGSDLTLCGADGQRRDVEGEIAVTEAAGSITGAVLTFRDVTASKRQREQDARNLRLRATARLAGGVAHEFNEFLTVILGSADHLRSVAVEDPGLRTMIDQIGRATAAAVEVTQELLSLSRAEVTFPRPLNLSDLIAGFCPELRRATPDTITITTHLDPSLVTIRADPDQMRLMIANAVLHARRAMPDGGTIRIETENVEVDPHQRGSRVQRFANVKVVDSRIHAENSDLDHAIERFYQPSAARRVTGTELLILLGIVQDANGRISLKTTPGLGATLEMLFPQEDGGEPVLTLEETAAASQSNPTILVVEEDPDVRALLHSGFDGCGYQVLEAVDAAEALLLAEWHEGPIDVLIAGAGLGTPNPTTSLKAFSTRRPETRLLLTCDGPRNLTQFDDFLKRGAQALLKPFGQQALQDRVREMLLSPRQGVN
jgi:PAS domain S-box-containing protein